MLAAAMNRSSSLGLLQVVLRTVGGHGPQVSDQMREHTVELLRQASTVAANPGVIGPNTPKEAIELAMRLRHAPGLSTQLAAVTAFDTLSPQLAQALLNTLQPSAA